MSIGMLVVLGCALAVCVVTDLSMGRIRDAVTLPALAVCLAIRLVGAGWDGALGGGLASGLLGLVVAAGPFLVVNRFGLMGLGDVKLMALVGAAAGFPAVLACLFGIGVFGGLHAAAVMAARAWVRIRARRADADLAPPRRATIPYAVAIALGTGWGLWMTVS